MSGGHFTFKIDPIQQFAKQSGTRQPVELTSFSFDDHRRLHHDDSSLSYYWPASRPGTSLSIGFEQRVSRDESINEHLDALLASLMLYEEKNGSSSLAVDLITWRGMVTKFLTCPYARKDGFEMNVTKLGNTVYMEEYVSPKTRAAKDAKESSDPRQALMAFWGVKYEALATTSQSWDACSRRDIEQRDLRQVNTNVQYCSVVRTRLGPVSMILGGEVDCCNDYKPTQPETRPSGTSGDEEWDDYGGMRAPSRPPKEESIVSHYVELKTSRVRTSAREQANFEKFKLLKFWAQSFLLGIPRIIVGYRDDAGHLQYEEQIETLKIPGLVRAGSGSWDGNVCLNFAGECLRFIVQTIRSKSEGTWRVTYSPNSPVVELQQLQAGGYGFLTQEYVNHKVARQNM